MLGYAELQDAKTKEDLGIIVWNRVHHKDGYKVSGLRVYIKPKVDHIDKTTATKAELILKNVFRLQKVGAIKKEHNLEDAMNADMYKYNANLLINGRRVFDLSVRKATSMGEFKRKMRGRRDYTRLSDKYFKKETMRKIKNYNKGLGVNR